MKKRILIGLFVFWHVAIAAQIIVDKGIYKANFSNTLRQPRYVSYTLYKGGGDCNRDSFDFKNDDPRLQTAVPKDYEGSGYDQGHLANAEDFAFDCVKDELTFRYYNCLPQTVNLNRGKWKSNETMIRKWSQKEKLYIVCGGFFGSKMIGNVSVPDYCWKVVQSTVTKKVLFCGWFSNTSPAKLDSLTVEALEKKLGKRVVLVK